MKIWEEKQQIVLNFLYCLGRGKYWSLFKLNEFIVTKLILYYIYTKFTIKSEVILLYREDQWEMWIIWIIYL
jgi:hypothetical protein